MLLVHACVTVFLLLFIQLAELPHEELLSTFKKEYLRNKEKISELSIRLLQQVMTSLTV